MSIETVTYISDLNPANPVGGIDTVATLDDHIRNMKTGIKNTFPSVAGAVSATDVELSYVHGVTSAVQTQINAKAPLASPTFTGNPQAPTPATADSSTSVATTAQVHAVVAAASMSATTPVVAANANQVWTNDGTTPKWGYASNNTAAVFTASGTWTCPAWVTRAKITVIGGGASGGTSTNSTPGVAGPAAGTAVKWATVTPSAAYTVTVGAGGVAAGAGTSTSPASGGASSVAGTGVAITANGGTASGGGTATGGDINVTGGSVAVGATPVPGGATLLGMPSLGAGQYGAGGGGGAVSGGAGNNGGSGIVIIEY